METDLPEGRKPRRGDAFAAVVERLGPKGRAVGRWGPYRVELRGGAPGDEVRGEVVRRRGDRVEGRLLERVAPGPDAATPRCAHFGTCGGCSHQDVRYARQLAELRRQVEEALAPLGAPAVEEVRGCADPWGYRNKMDFTFAARRWVTDDEPEDAPRDFALGLHVPGRFDKVLDVGRCDLAFEAANPVLATLRREAQARGLEPWDAREHTGLLRHVVLRRGEATGEVLLYLVTSREEPARVDPYVAAVVAAHPELTTVVQGVTDRVSGVAVGDTERVLHGPGVIHEVLGGVTFELSPTSFFQTNTAQAEALVDVVRELAGEGRVLYDLYCGAGTFSLTLAGRFAEVHGFELSEAAVADGRRNAAANGVSNVRLVAGDLAATLGADGAADAGPAPDVLVTDPPRAGMHARVVAAVRRLAPPRVVCVSCNARAAARDLAPLLVDGYAVRRVVPLDLFPHTPHVEVALLLERGALPPSRGEG